VEDGENRVPKGVRELPFTVLDPEDTKVAEGRATLLSADTGTFAASVTLPGTGRLGLYRVVFEGPAGPGQAEFKVEYFVKPAFAVTVDSPTAKVGLGDVVNSTKQLFAGELQPPKGIRWVFVGESENMQDMIGSMVMAIGFGILFIFFVLASLYESFVTPFTIMLALPLAMCGAFVALLITGAAFSIFTAMGLIMLLGIACKNSILMVDYTARLIAEGKDRTEAIVEAGKIRLRPILMTSIALIAGMIPVAIGLNEALDEELGQDEDVIIYGCDVAMSHSPWSAVPMKWKRNPLAS